MKFKLIATILSLVMLLGMTAGVQADEVHKLGLAATYDAHVKFVGSYDLASINLGHKLSLNVGGFCMQNTPEVWDRLSFGPTANVEYHRLFAGVGYTVNNKRTIFSVGLKF